MEIEIDYQDGEEIEYVTVDLEFIWDKKKYTKKENAGIANFIATRFDLLEKAFYAKKK